MSKDKEVPQASTTSDTPVAEPAELSEEEQRAKLQA